MEKPSVLFLIALTGIGSAILSPITVGGIPVLSLIIPFALLAHYLYGMQEGIVVGLVGSVLSGILIANVEGWDSVIYALATATTVYAFDVVNPKQQNPVQYILFAALGTLLFEVLLDVYRGDGILLRPDHFLGSNPSGGIRLLFNVILTGVLLSFYEAPAPGKK